MKEYHKINSIFKRNMTGDKKLIPGQWSSPEFECLADAVWEFTEKVDGTNIRVHHNGEKIVLGGRSENSQIPAKLIERLNNLFDPVKDDLFEMFGPDTVLYGEGYGANIQKGGGNYSANQDFVLFDIRTPSGWLARKDVDGVAHKLALRSVPVLTRGTLWRAVDLAKEGFNSAWGPFQAEGIVARPAAELCDRRGNRIIAKIKCRDFDQAV